MVPGAPVALRRGRPELARAPAPGTARRRVPRLQQRDSRRASPSASRARHRRPLRRGACQHLRPGAGRRGSRGDRPGPRDVTRSLTTRRPVQPAERDLVRCAQAGEVSAFEQLVGEHADRLYAVVVRLVDDRTEAEDVVQESLLRAWRGIGRFQGHSMFSTWLYRIAVNESNRALERRLRQGVAIPVDEESVQIPAPALDGPASQAEQDELRHGIDTAIASLAPPYRTALVLRDIEGLSTREAAKIAGVGEAAFKSRLHQARLKVRAALGDAALIAAPI